MAFKFAFTLSALLAVANAGLISYAANPALDAVAATHQNVVRSFDGTVSQYSKSVDTPYSSVRKIDTRINNNVYTPTIAKSISYAAPVHTKTIYATAPAPVVEKSIDIQPAVTKSFSYAAPAVYSAPALTKTITYAAPAAHVVAKPVAYAAPVHHVVAKPIAYAAPAAHVVAKPLAYAAPTVHTYAAAPAVAKTVYAAPTLATTNISHGSAATTYTHNAPGVSGYGTSQTVHYSPAEAVSHMSFDGFGTHWGF